MMCIDDVPFVVDTETGKMAVDVWSIFGEISLICRDWKKMPVGWVTGEASDL